MQICPDCQATVEDDAIFCDQCGYALKPKPVATKAGQVGEKQVAAEEQQPMSGLSGKACPACGYMNLAVEKFCANCGVQLPASNDSGIPSELVEPDSWSPTQAELSVKAAGTVRSCPNCGAENSITDAFCAICGFGLTPMSQQAESAGPVPPLRKSPTTPPVSQTTPAQVVAAVSAYDTLSSVKIPGRLVSTATNTSLPLPAKAEIIIGRRDPERGIYPDVDLSAQGSASNSVSRQHARLWIQGNQMFVEDLNSTNATFINRQRAQPGQRYLLNHGDELRLGGVVLVFYTH